MTVNATKKLWIREGFSGIKVMCVQTPTWSQRKYVTIRKREDQVQSPEMRVHSWIRKVAASEQGDESEDKVRKLRSREARSRETLKGNVSQTLHSIWIYEDLKDPDSGSLGWGQIILIYNKLTADCCWSMDSTLSIKVIGNRKNLAFTPRWETFGGLWADRVI